MKDSELALILAELADPANMRLENELRRIEEKIVRETHVPEGYRLVLTSDGYSVVRVR